MPASALLSQFDSKRANEMVREVLADARSSAAQEWKILPAVTALDVLGAEPVGVEVHGVRPQRRIMMQRIDSHRDKAARLDTVSVHGDVACRGL